MGRQCRSRKMPQERNPFSLNHPQKMHIFLPILLLLSFTVPLHSSSLAPPHLLKRLHRNDVDPPQEYVEISKPLPTDNSTPSCTLPILSHDFGNTIGLPPVSANYSAPSNCTWTRVTLEIRVSSQGDQYDRIAAVWLDGAELIRTSTAEPNANGIFWNVRKDVTRYSSLLAKENLTLSVMLENIVNEIYTGVYKVNVTFFYYDIDAVNHPALLLSLPSDKASFNLYDKPADLIVPISGTGEDDNGYWFRILSGSETRSVGIQLPLNAYKAVVEIYVSFHGNDEFWYSNPPDSYIDLNKLNTERGNGAYREIMLTIDGKLVGSVVPFPVIFTGGINPLFWEPIVSIGAFNLPSYDFDLTPFLGLILDENVHYFGLGVAESIPFWLVDANLHIWLDNSVNEVQARSEYKVPHFSTDTEFKFEDLDGEFEIEVKRKSEIIGWVNSTAGNYTTNITREMEFKNEIEFKKNGGRKTVEQKVKEQSVVTVLSDNGTVISLSTVSREYPLKISSETMAGFAVGTYLMNNKLENSIKVKKIDSNSTSELSNSQECNGWMFVQDHDVVSGAANTQQNYKFKDGSECYSRKVAASNGKILNDNFSSLCQSSF